MFTKQTLIPITVDGADQVPEAERNTIYIRSAMTYGMQQRIAGAIIAGDVGTGGTALHTDVASWQITRLVENIGKWTGPDFRGVELNRANIERLDPPERNPLLQAVLDAITARDAAALPNSTPARSGNSGVPSSEAPAEAP